MGYLTAALGSDASKITVSMRVRIPLLTPPLDFPGATSLFSSASLGGLTQCFDVGLFYASTPQIFYSINSPVLAGFIDTDDGPVPADAQINIANDDGGDVGLGAWLHAFLSVDNATGAVIPVGNSDATLRHSNAFFIDGVRTNTGSSASNAGPGNIVGDQSFDVPFTGNSLFLPGPEFGDNGGGRQAFFINPALQYACVQVWFGQYITDLSPFGTFVDGVWRPIDLDGSTAVAAFGTPHIFFNGSDSSTPPFNQNQGTLGAFTKVGTVDDYVPGPGPVAA